MELYPYQIEFLGDTSRLRMCLKARQIGFSTVIANEMVRDALSYKNHLALCVSASERQAMNVLSYCYEQIRPLEPKFKEETKTSFILANGSAVYSLPNNPGTVRGFNAQHVYLDEFAHFQDDKEMFTAILPSVSRKGRLTVVSTPMGKRGEFFRLWDQDTRFKKYRFDHTVCPDLDIEDLRATMDEVSFRQEYCCDFIDEATSFFPYDLILSAVDDGLSDMTTYTGSNPVYLGVDFGKLVDSTVIVAVEKGDPSRVIHVKEFQGVDFSEQFAYLETISQGLKATRISVDSTGYGIPLLEQAQKKLGALVEGVTFTAAVKEQMATALRVGFENEEIRIPRNDKLIQQLHTLERSVTTSGTIRYRHTEGGHDDYTWALAMAFAETTEAGTFEGIEQPSGRRETYEEYAQPSGRRETYEEYAPGGFVDAFGTRGGIGKQLEESGW